MKRDPDVLRIQADDRWHRLLRAYDEEGEAYGLTDDEVAVAALDVASSRVRRARPEVFDAIRRRVGELVAWGLVAPVAQRQSSLNPGRNSRRSCVLTYRGREVLASVVQSQGPTGRSSVDVHRTRGIIRYRWTG